ncbi:unnamed protein product [Pedinophyceae sp. YPF-701]|nr:unnamed protein product [Pedinophyceae sp. YPF-701]
MDEQCVQLAERENAARAGAEAATEQARADLEARVATLQAQADGLAGSLGAARRERRELAARLWRTEQELEESKAKVADQTEARRTGSRKGEGAKRVVPMARECVRNVNAMVELEAVRRTASSALEEQLEDTQKELEHAEERLDGVVDGAARDCCRHSRVVAGRGPRGPRRRRRGARRCLRRARRGPRGPVRPRRPRGGARGGAQLAARRTRSSRGWPGRRARQALLEERDIEELRARCEREERGRFEHAGCAAQLTRGGARGGV